MGWAGEIATGKPESGSIVCSISIFSDIAAKTILNSLKARVVTPREH